MDLWFNHVSEVEIVAPLENRSENSSNCFYKHKNIFFNQVPAINFLNLKSVILSFLKLPGIIFKIVKTMRKADHLHLRCPGNIGLIACFVQIFFPNKPKTAKYAGNWDPKAEQPWTYKLQKWILGNTLLTQNMQVLIYGDWPNQSKNIRPFFTASFSEKESKEVEEKNFKQPFTFLFVGNLVSGKQPLKAIRLVKNLYNRNQNVRLEIYGEGIEENSLKALCQKENLNDFVHFRGNCSLEDLKSAYKKAHFLILPSRSEGWPKAIAEAMFFGCIPIATRVSCIPLMLDYGKRGVFLEDIEKSNWEEGYSDLIEKSADKIELLLQNIEELEKMSDLAKHWSQEYTLEKLESGIMGILAMDGKLAK